MFKNKKIFLNEFFSIKLTNKKIKIIRYYLKLKIIRLINDFGW